MKPRLIVSDVDMALAQQAVRGAAWTIGSSMAARLIGVVGTIFITHYLDPEIMGEVTSAAIVVVSANMLSNFGLGNYAVAKYKDGPDVTFVSTVVYMALGVLALGGVLLFGDRLSQTVNAPTMAQYLPGLVLSTFLRRIAHMPDKVLAREMRFGPIGIAIAVGELTYSLMSVWLAMQGWGGMAIVWANVAQSAIMAAIVISQVSWRSWLAPHKIRWERLKDQARFGIPLGLIATSYYASTTWDNLIYSRIFGPYSMGLYNMGYKVAAMPAQQIGEQVGGVLFPSMSNADGEAKGRALIRSTALMSLLVFPLGLGLFAISKSLVATIMSPEWQGVAPILAALALITIVQPVGWASGSYLLAKGYNWALSLKELVKLAALAGGLLLFAPYGPVWACAGPALAFTITAMLEMYLLHKDGIKMRPLLHAMTRPLLPCLPMVAAVFAVRAVLEGAGCERPILFLLAEIAVGAVVFVPAAFMLSGPIARDFLGLIKSALGRGDDDDDDEISD